jgi:hypothetical protein
MERNCRRKFQKLIKRVPSTPLDAVSHNQPFHRYTRLNGACCPEAARVVDAISTPHGTPHSLI